ncbi:hypothetical protein [Azospirillum argentinense]|uniref:Uncharacterized protein n=1 Tax=Azospirillum brasilense TaxID=192 RepID=A0A4D8QAD0_AZOBR|nr:hypothetical protein [Azospirillum argentinense]QCO07315.1 hypothetical protein D3867_36145 [Azospirillum argentinense]
MSLLSRLNLKPLVINKPSTLPLVRVAIQPARAGRHVSAARLDITFSRELGKQIGITASGQKAAIYVDGQFIALCDPDAGRKLFGAATKEYQVGVKNDKAENAALHFASSLPPVCVTEKCPTQGPKQIEVENGVLIIELPDSFIRPEYLTSMEVAAAVNQREWNPPLVSPSGIEPMLVEPAHIPSIFSHPQDGGVVQAPAQTVVEATSPTPDDTIIQPDQPQPVEADGDQNPEVATQVHDESVEPEGPAAAHSSVDDAGLQGVERCITPPPPASEKVYVPPSLEDRLYDHLLQLAREGKACPDNQALATHINSNPNSVSATLSMMKSRGRVSVCYVSAEGERRNEVVRGWQRVFTMVADKATTAAPQPVNAVEAAVESNAPPAESPAAPPPKTVAPAASPRRVPLTPSKGRQLSEAELELQEVVGARKPVAAATDVDADFEYLRDKKVPVFRVPSNKAHPFRLNDRPATAAEITAKAARVRQISGGR